MATPDSFVDGEIAKPEPSDVSFNGDVVDVWHKSAEQIRERFPDREDAQPQIKLVIRDWAASEGADKPKLRYTKYMNVSTDRKSELQKLCTQIEQKTGTRPTLFSMFLGLEGEWRLYEVINVTDNGDFSRSDIPEYKGTPTTTKPNPLPAYVPKDRGEESAPAEAEPAMEITDEARGAFRALVAKEVAANGGGLTEEQIRKAVSKNMEFRSKYGPAFAATIQGSLTKEELVADDSGRYVPKS